MTVQAIATPESYVGNGVTTLFPVNFNFFLPNDLLVALVDTTSGSPVTSTLTLNGTPGYSVAGGLSAVTGLSGNGSITTSWAPTAYQTIIITPNFALTQQTHYVPNSPFPAASHENALDRLTLIAQQQACQIQNMVTPGLTAAQINAQLLAQLASTAAGQGDALVAGLRTATGAIPFLQHQFHEHQAFEVNTYFGAVGDGATDDTTPLQTAINAAWAAATEIQPSGSGAVYVDQVPSVFLVGGERYKITTTLTVPQDLRIVVVGEGSASIEPSGAFPAITAANAYQFFCKGINFIGGTQAVKIQNNNTESGFFEFQNCEFHAQTQWCVTATPITPGGGNSVNHLSSVMTFKKCKFFNPAQAVQTWCDYTRLEDCWGTWGDTLCAAGTAFFAVFNGPTTGTVGSNTSNIPQLTVNNLEGGTLILDNFVGVPNMSTGKGNVRWVDNYWRTLIRRSRFGQEASGGIPVVYNFAPAATSAPYSGGCVVIRDSETWASGSRVDGCVVGLFSDVPGMIVLDGNFGPINAPIVLNLGIGSIPTYISGSFPTPNRSFGFFFGTSSPAQQPNPAPHGFLIDANLLPYCQGVTPNDSSSGTAPFLAASLITPYTNVTTPAEPNKMWSYCSNQVNSNNWVVTLAGVFGPTSGGLSAGGQIGTLTAAHCPSRNLLLSAVRNDGTAGYIQILTSGVINTGLALSSPTVTVNLDGISFRINN